MLCAYVPKITNFLSFRPKNDDDNIGGMGVAMPILAPPPTVQQAFSDTSPRFNPFDQSEVVATTDSTKPPPLSLGE